MRITSFSREQIIDGIEKITLPESVNPDQIRILFSPFRIDASNFSSACASYSLIRNSSYSTVVVLESHPGSAEKKLPMPSNKSFSTPLGDVPVNDRLRNDFADEDDDFFVNDDAFDDQVSIYDQLMMLQCTLDSYDVLSIQITEESTFIIKELVASIAEILRNKNALLICCTNLPASEEDDIKRLIEMAGNDQFSSMMNYMNSGESGIEGMSSFLTGLLVAADWNLDVSLSSAAEGEPSGNLLSAHAQLQGQPIHG
jgi:predicted class III extradiol MEMO1 family dioxygenase